MNQYDVIVIGSGPAGYTLASLCGKDGLKTLVIEKSKIGGVCLNEGCIPTKAFINIAETIDQIKKSEILGINVQYNGFNKAKISERLKDVAGKMSKGVEYLFKTNLVEVIEGRAEIQDKNCVIVNGVEYKCKNLVIATGSRNKDYSNFLADSSMDTSKIWTSTEALFTNDVPKSLVVIGGGAIGVEFANIYAELGTQVTILEYMPVLVPTMDEDCGKLLERSFRKRKIKVLSESKLLTIAISGDQYEIGYERKGKEDKIHAEYILFALGRMPNTDSIGIDKLNIKLNNAGYIEVDNNMQINEKGVFAIGDVVANSPLLAHVAYDEARMAYFALTNKQSNFAVDYENTPFCIYTDPQLASFGKSEQKLKRDGVSYTVLKSFFKASGKAMAQNKTDGFVKILIDDNNMILGASISGANATELIHELIIFAKSKMDISKLSQVMFAHPTLSELIGDTVKAHIGLGL